MTWKRLRQFGLEGKAVPAREGGNAPGQAQTGQSLGPVRHAGQRLGVVPGRYEKLRCRCSDEPDGFPGRRREPCPARGSWLDDARSVRAAYRYHAHPDDRDGHIGFRCARVRGEPGQPAGKSDAPGAGAAPSGAPGRQGDGTRSEGGKTLRERGRDLWKKISGLMKPVFLRFPHHRSRPAQENLNRFCAEQRVVSVDKQLVQDADRGAGPPHWLSR